MKSQQTAASHHPRFAENLRELLALGMRLEVATRNSRINRETDTTDCLAAYLTALVGPA